LTTALCGGTGINWEEEMPISTATLTAIDLLNSVNTFYESAWNKLALGGGILITVVGIVIPILVVLYQRNETERQEKKFIKQLEEKSQEFYKNLRLEIEKLKSEMLDKQIAGTAFSMINVGAVYYEEKKYHLAFVNYLAALEVLFISDSFTLLGSLLELIKISLINIYGSEISPDEEKKFNELIQKLENFKSKEQYKELVKSIKKQFIDAKVRQKPS